MIEIKNLYKSFDGKEVLKGVNLTIKDGSILGLVGINGAGKSTLLRLLSGIYSADKGEIQIDKENLFDNDKIKSKIFFLPDEPFYNTHATPLSLIDLYANFYNLNKEVYVNYLQQFDLPLNKSMHNFSKGMKRQVFISLAIAIAPKYLLLDEAFDGLDPIARLNVKKALINLIDQKKTTVIISSHSLRELEDICDSYALIDHQSIASFGDLIESIGAYHKFTIAFEEELNSEDFTDIEFVRFEKEKRIIKVIVKCDYTEFEEKIKAYNPLIIDESGIDFEELFMIEVQSRGYLK